VNDLTQALTDDEVAELADLRPHEPYPKTLMDRYKLSPFRNLELPLVATCVSLMAERDAALSSRPARDDELCCTAVTCTRATVPGTGLCPFHKIAGADFHAKRLNAEAGDA
jgi:hypothetical protein